MTEVSPTYLRIHRTIKYATQTPSPSAEAIRQYATQEPTPSRITPIEKLRRAKEVYSGSIVFDVPSEIKTAGAETEYTAFARASYIDLPLEPYETRLQTKLQQSYEYVSKYQTYTYEGKQLSWKELKEREPALILKQMPSGTYMPSYDYLLWRESYRERREQKGLDLAGVAADISLSFLSIFDIGTWGAVIGGKLPEHMAEKQYRDVMDIQRGRGVEVWGRVQAPAYTSVILPTIGGIAIGAGIGALKATAIGSRALLTVGSRTLTVGGAVELGIAGYGTYEVGKSAIRDPVYTAIQMGMSAPSAILGYRSGYRMGYGRTEAYLYGKHTFKVGTPEYIRFSEAIRISRRLQYVKSSYAKPLDFAKDIMRLSPSEANKVFGYLRGDASAVIGGSGASYTQIRPSLWSRFRSVKPRDIDILVKDLTQAKGYFGKAPHKIDIHGFEFGGKAGRYHRFGFITQTPRRIGEFKYLRLGEQSFRKGIGATALETKYRAFKDLPDFVMTSKQLISSSRVSWSPFTRWRGISASKHLKIFMHPEKAPAFGKTETFFGKAITRIIKPAPLPKPVYTPSGYVDYVYPSYAYPMSYAGIGSYLKPVSYKPMGYVTPSYKVPKVLSYKPFVHLKPVYRLPSYTPSKKITGYLKPPTYILPDYIPTKIPPYKPPSYPPPVPPEKPPVEIDVLGKRKMIKLPKEVFDLGYKFREFKLSDLFKNIKI